MRILVLYGTSQGHTRKIADFVSDRLSRVGHDVTAVDVMKQPPTLRLADFNAAIIAARVHAGLYQRQIVRFLERNNATLSRMPNAFISVSMSAANLQPGDMDRAVGYTDRLIQRTNWRPRQTMQVAGARLYTRHSAIGRWILGLVDRKRLDTNKDYVWTDWDGLEQFANEFADAPVQRQMESLPPGVISMENPA